MLRKDGQTMDRVLHQLSSCFETVDTAVVERQEIRLLRKRHDGEPVLSASEVVARTIIMYERGDQIKKLRGITNAIWGRTYEVKQVEVVPFVFEIVALRRVVCNCFGDRLPDGSSWIHWRGARAVSRRDFRDRYVIKDTECDRIYFNPSVSESFHKPSLVCLFRRSKMSAEPVSVSVRPSAAPGLSEPTATITGAVQEEVAEKAPARADKPNHGFRFWAIVAALAFTALLSALEGTIITSALPIITRDLGGGNSFIWVPNGYFLATIVMLPLMAQASELFGRHWLTLISVAVFTLGSEICGGASNQAMLIGGRVV
nr:efflux pump fus6 [Quercus suber]